MIRIASTLAGLGMLWNTIAALAANPSPYLIVEGRENHWCCINDSSPPHYISDFVLIVGADASITLAETTRRIASPPDGPPDSGLGIQARLTATEWRALQALANSAHVGVAKPCRLQPTLPFLYNGSNAQQRLSWFGAHGRRNQFGLGDGPICDARIQALMWELSAIWVRAGGG